MVDRAFDLIRRRFPEISLAMSGLSALQAWRSPSRGRRLVSFLTSIFWLQTAVNGAKDRAHRRGMYR